MTGVGLVCASGEGIEALQTDVVAGRSRLTALSPQVARGLTVAVGGRLPEPLTPTAAASRAIAGALTDAPTQARIGIALGTGLGDTLPLEEAIAAEAETPDPRAWAPHTITRALAAEHRLTGPRRTFTTTCVSALCAVEQARADLLLGRADAVVCVGVEGLSRTILGGFCALGALSTTAAPNGPAVTDGIVLGEGACALLLERAASAQERGAKVLARVLGQAVFADALHITTPDTSGAGMKAAVEQALDEAGIAPDQVDRIALTADASPGYAAAYAAALGEVFGPDWTARVIGWEAVTGHALAASGTLGIAFAADHLARSGERAALTLTVGFGGLNGAVVVGSP